MSSIAECERYRFPT